MAIETTHRARALVMRLKGLGRRHASFPASGYSLLSNVNHSDEKVLRKRALLIYVTEPFTLRPDAPEFLTHQNKRQCIQIARLLGEFGYVVDVADVRHRELKVKREYDLILVNRTSLNYLKLAADLQTRRILLATTTCNLVHNRNLRRRHELLLKRRGVDLRPRRIYGENMPFAAEADAIFAIGNDFSAGAWREASNAPILRFNNYGFEGTRFEERDFALARRRFLFFASGSQVQKGLDLLLEIFPQHPELELYVCSDFEREPEFVACYENELHRTPNIHAVGRVEVNGSDFTRLVRSCAYVVAPTCSEGQPGSVVQCMHTGLVPIATHEAGIDLEDFGVTFASDDLNEIERVIVESSNASEDWLKERSLRTRRVCETRYSEAAFMDRWRSMLAETLINAR